MKSGRQENVIKIIIIEGRAAAQPYCRFIVLLFQIESKKVNQWVWGVRIRNNERTASPIVIQSLGKQ